MPSGRCVMVPALALMAGLASACAGDDGGARGAGCDRLERLVVTISRADYLRRVDEARRSSTGASTTIGAGTTPGSIDAEEVLPPIGFDACVAICEEHGEVASPWSCEVTMSDATSVTIACLWTRAECAPA